MAETLPGEIWDVVVIGAGPAGGLASLDLARRGLRVLLVEKRRFPRWKVCGTCFNGQAQAALVSVGQGHLLESLGGRPLRRLRLGLGGRQATCALPQGWAVSRSRFDQALVEAAVSAGVMFRPQTTAQLGPVSAHARSVSLCQGRHQELVQAAVVLVAAGLAHRCLENEPTPASITGRRAPSTWRWAARARWVWCGWRTAASTWRAIASWCSGMPPAMWSLHRRRHGLGPGSRRRGHAAGDGGGRGVAAAI
ncbi:NAD(P)/FAD-dependent oxidoreductase [Synechococcus sp. 1G10]|uniref:NAD(P)/FAD-dependent oxidoreductase n=1 Tax=Synechococcus sp. 1G10 TaxID=2025605 RepID=UPI003511A451